MERSCYRLKLGANCQVLRRDAWSRYPLLYQNAFLGRQMGLPLQCPRCFWYNASIKAILNGLNDIQLLVFALAG